MSPVRVPERVKKLRDSKKRSVSSRRWLLRQLNDPFVAKAKSMGYRSRAAFKLEAIDAKFHLLRPKQVVVDLGCAPGGWLQVVQKRARGGMLFGLDLQPVEPLEGVHLLQGDFTEPSVVEAIFAALNGQRVDIVLSDLAAPACGIPKVDHIRIMALLRQVMDFAGKVLNPEGAVVAKVLRGGAEPVLLAEMKKAFKKVSHYKPPASRQDSSEIYVVAQGFRAADAKEAQ